MIDQYNMMALRCAQPSRLNCSFLSRMTAGIMAFLFSTGCMLHHPPHDPVIYDAVMQGSRVEYDPGKRSRKLTGPWLPFTTKSGRGTYLLRSFDSDGTAVYQIYAVHEADYWYYMTSAHDRRSGEKMEFIEIDREITSNNRSREHCAVQMGRTHLENAADAGILISVVGRRGEMNIDVPPSYIRGFLDKHDEIKKLKD